MYLLYINSEHCLPSACCELAVCDLGKLNMRVLLWERKTRDKIQCGKWRACQGLHGKTVSALVCVYVHACVCSLRAISEKLVWMPCRVEVCRTYPRVGDGYPEKMALRNVR